MSQSLSVVHDFEKELSSPGQIKALQSVLPTHIDVKQFCRLAVMAVQKSPSLLDAERQSLFQSLQNCAVDGLIPDGREAALVEFKTKNRQTNQFEKRVQYMPMVGGILKRVRQSGQIALITARCVYRNDEFAYWIDETGEHLRHVPAFAKGEDQGDMYLVYAMAKLTNGEVVVEPMSLAEIEKVKKSSRTSGAGPWVDWFERMAQKSVLHRISRRLPCSSDVAELMSRDHWMYEEGLSTAAAVAPKSAMKKISGAAGSEQEQNRLSAPQADQSAPTEDDALMMNDIMGRIMSAENVDQLKDMAMEIDRLHPNFIPDAVRAVDDRRKALGGK